MAQPGDSRHLKKQEGGDSWEGDARALESGLQGRMEGVVPVWAEVAKGEDQGGIVIQEEGCSLFCRVWS